MQKHIYKCRSGASLIVAIGMSALLILITIGLSRYIQSSMRNTQRVEANSSAFFAAEGEMEQALHNVAKPYDDADVLSPFGFGYETTPTDEQFSSDYNGAEGRYKVHSVAEQDGATFLVPATGYGTLGGAKCDGSFYAKQDEDCRWNILNAGSPASVFLYNEVKEGSEYMGTDLKMHIKTADGSTTSLDCSDLNAEQIPICNPVAVSWEILEGAGDANKFVADSCTVSDACKRDVLAGCTNEQKKSPNYYNSNQVKYAEFEDGEYDWDLTQKGMDLYGNGQCGVKNDGYVPHNYDVESFLSGTGQFIGEAAERPRLRLNVVKAGMPDLVYQIRADEEVLDANIFVEATGVSGDYPLQHSTKLVFIMPQDMSSTVFSTGFLEQ